MMKKTSSSRVSIGNDRQQPPASVFPWKVCGGKSRFTLTQIRRAVKLALAKSKV
jgi:hypothetical protein